MRPGRIDRDSGLGIRDSEKQIGVIPEGTPRRTGNRQKRFSGHNQTMDHNTPSALSAAREKLSPARIAAFSLTLFVHALLLMVLAMGNDVERFQADADEERVELVIQPRTAPSEKISSSKISGSVPPANLQTPKATPLTSINRLIRSVPQPLAMALPQPQGVLISTEKLSTQESSAAANSNSEIIAGAANDSGSGSGIGDGSGSGAGNGLADTPLAVTSPAPQYPPLSERQGEQGEVIVLIHVSAQGVPVKVDILQSSGFGRLDRAMIKQVLERWRYQPATKRGVPVASYVLARHLFTLDAEKAKAYSQSAN
jgi:TonB family protein